MPTSRPLIHHEDLVVGSTHAFGARTITKDEIIAYAREFDPQPMHLDEEAARKTIVGGLCAAGYHTCALLMAMLWEGFIIDLASEGSPGMIEAKWLRPVRPGDTLSLRMTIVDKRDLASRPTVGMAHLRYELINQSSESVLSMLGIAMTRRRNPATAAEVSLADARSAGTPLASKPPKLVSLWDMPEPPQHDPFGHFFEDRQIGESKDLGTHTFTRDEIVRFARQFDPQPFHMDEDAAKSSVFGGLCASGWHTCAIYIRHIVRERLGQETAIRAAGRPLAAYGPSPGFRDLRWLRPVMVGDTLEFKTRLTEKIDLKSRPDRGILVSQTQARNQKGEIAFAMTGQIFVERRQAFARA